ncbi:carbohydrate binding domain-containing protein [Bifidobacterium animalis]|uniref:carbohydrate binding domain-containing protein n=1 Tax=Bifidobacterium animalis TaxID=28025 RepID=UPI003F8E7FE8
MPTHVRIKPEPIDALANMSALALRNALGTQTRHSGTAYWDNGDGTGIITGDGARDGINRYNPDTDVQLPILDTSGIEADISRADSQITQITNQITQVNNQLATTNKSIDEQTAKLQAQAQAITAQATKDKAAVDDSVSALGKRMSAVETTADDLGKHVTDVQATVNGQASTLITFDQRISANASSGAATAKLASDIKQTVTGLSATLSQTTTTANDALKQVAQVQATAQGIKTTLSQGYATKTEVANISVGGTNLLIDTKAFGTSNATPNTTGYLNTKGRAGDSYNGFQSITASDSDGTGYVLAQWNVNDVTAGETYTVSFNAKGTGKARIYLYDSRNNNIDYTHSASSTGAPVLGADGQCNIALTTEWKRYWITYHIGGGNPSNKNLLFRNDNKAAWSIYAVKLERGTKPTDWSPAPQDMQPAGDYATSTQVEQTAQGLSARISSNATTLAGTKTDINQIKITAQGLQASLSDVTKTADSTQTTLTQYKAAQDQLSAQLSKTTSTAQGAVTAAAKAQATADGISLNLSQNYTSAKDADAKYATKAALKTTSDGITAQFSQTSQSIAGIQHDVDGIKIDATGIHGTLTQITDSQGVTNKTVKSIQDTVSGLQSTLTSTTKTANSALTNTTTLKTGLDSVNLTMSQHYQQMLANTQQGENLIPNGNADPNAKPFNGWKINQHAYEIVFPGGQNHVDFMRYFPPRPIPKGHTYRFSMQVRVTSGTCSGEDHIIWGFDPSWDAHNINLAGVGTNWELFTYDITTPRDENQIFMSSFVGSAGAKTIQFRALSVIDITVAAQAQSKAGDAYNRAASVSADLTGFKTSVSQTYLPKSDAANTYTTSSQVQQTAKQISAQVVSNYKGADGSGLATQSSLAATKKDILAQVSQTYTTKDGFTQQLNSKVQQTATSLTTTFTNQLNAVKTQASTTQTQVNSIQAMIREDSAGIHVGRLVDGKQSGYSALVSSDGSFQVLDGTGASYATLKPLNLTLGTMDGDKGNCAMSLGHNGMSITYEQLNGHGGFGHDTYGMITGIGGININSPDGSYITAGTGGISIQGSDGSHIHMGPMGISIANGNGNKIDISPNGFLIMWNKWKYSFSGDKNGILHASADKRLR